MHFSLLYYASLSLKYLSDFDAYPDLVERPLGSVNITGFMSLRISTVVDDVFGRLLACSFFYDRLKENRFPICINVCFYTQVCWCGDGGGF